MNDLILFGKSLADPTRIRILAALRVAAHAGGIGELCVCELCDALELRQSTLSSQLEIIREAGLLTARKDGKWTYYGIEPSHAALLDAAFARYADALRVDERLRRDAEGVERRLSLRDTRGCCVLGFGQLDAAPQALKP